MMKFIHSLGAGKNNVGPITYRDDFARVVQPAIEQEVDGGESVIISTLTEVHPEVAKKVEATRIVQVLHSSVYKNELKMLDNFTAGGVPTVFISHYAEVANAINSKTKHACKYIPMSIDLTRIPKHMGVLRDRVVYFGNVYLEKEHTYYKFREAMKEICGCSEPSLDTISFGMLYEHGDLYRSGIDVKGRELRLVANYRYGIGVGICAIEMLAMGLNVMVMGDYYAGVITDDTTFDMYHRTNFNSKGGTGRYVPDNFARELACLRTTAYAPDMSKLDMRTYINQYIEAVKWSHEKLKAQVY